MYDAGHFDIYVGDDFEQVVADELDFLGRHVPARLTRETGRCMARRSLTRFAWLSIAAASGHDRPQDLCLLI
ncbi:MAG: hypothetical protein V9G13_13355 [Marmoricola sp.]